MPQKYAFLHGMSLVLLDHPLVGQLVDDLRPVPTAQVGLLAWLQPTPDADPELVRNCP